MFRTIFNLDSVSGDYPPALLLQQHEDRGHTHLLYKDLQRTTTRAVLPDRAVLLHALHTEGTSYYLVSIDEAVLLLAVWRQSSDIWVSGADEQVLRGLVTEIAERMPARTDDRQVEVTFADLQAGSRTVTLDVRPWAEVDGNYSPYVREAVTALASHQPSADQGPRLILWHGVPGTGKTSAVRSLLHSWKPWVDPVVIPDPEALLSDGRFLRRIVLNQDDEDNRWKLIILEDAESLLRKETGGKQMSKLLNLADGLLGQGLRCLWLITTNEELGRVHPALVRPGRCLARVEFGPLPAAQASALLGRPVTGPMTLAEVMTAKPVEVIEPDVAVGQYL